MYDLLVIGGGINGVGIARDAAGRGLKVVLCEKDDLAAHTSSSSTKLIHGGLRYLEHYDFALVRKALIEREVLLRSAPHIIWPLRFVLPHQKDLRPAWLIRTGLFLYDHLGGRELLPGTKTLRRNSSDKFAPLKQSFTTAFEYSDCWVEDSRLVVLNAVDAAEHGADVLTRTACKSLQRHGDHWTATLEQSAGDTREIDAKIVVNAAGPWVDDVAGLAFPGRNASTVRLVKGSHIVTRKLYDGDHCYFFQNGDGRIMFAIPYEDGRYTLVGTTDVPYTADKDAVEISDDEIDYLCASASEYFEQPVTPKDIVSTYSGVRPLYDDQSENASTVTRDYVLSYDKTGGAPILSVYGGKITTFRTLAESALKVVENDLPNMTTPWTKDAPLPGGDLPNADFDAFQAAKANAFPWLDRDTLHRLARAYGSRIDAILDSASSVEDLGEDFGGGLFEAEVRYLMDREFAETAQDVLWRRSKLGLHAPDETMARLETWMSKAARPQSSVA
ncbi:MAG: glycerol-3-phosphate dehydrogenase [Pseudomonadota bacterium]